MKKILFLLIAAIILTTLFGCNGGTPNTDNPGTEASGTEDPAEKRKNTDINIEYDTESIVNANGDKSIEFSVKGKKYKYKENNLLILLVKNKTDTNYSVSVSVDFLDSTGKTLKSETQTFEGFATGYENFFAFEPGILFDNYTYEINVEEYTGECYAKDVDVWFGGLVETRFPDFKQLFIDGKLEDYTKYPTIKADRYYKSTTASVLDTSYKFILIDNTGEVYFTGIGGLRLQPYMTDVCNSEYLYQVHEDTLTWPENFTGDVIGICAMEYAKPPESMENPFQTDDKAEK
ncbi:MAG: hypothetical protein IKT70_09790 [Clostridia bacterium]|nr:hypothetical protein [Clostridia bacterium]